MGLTQEPKGGSMKLLRSKVWSPWDIASLKLAVFVFGIIVGGYYSEWALANRWLLTILLILFAIRPVYAYWIKKD
jgi:hypothetical protein